MSKCTHPITVDELRVAPDVRYPFEDPDWWRACAICGLEYNRSVRILDPLREQCELAWSVDFRRFVLDDEDALEIAG